MASEHFKIVGLIAPGLIFTIEFVFLPQKYHIACFYLMSWFWGLLQRALLQRLFWSDETLLIEKLTMIIICEPSGRYPEGVQSNFEA